MLGLVFAGLTAACCVLYSLHSRVTLSKTAQNFLTSAVVLMYIRFCSSAQLTAGFGDKKIFRQMQKCNVLFFCFFLDVDLFCF